MEGAQKVHPGGGLRCERASQLQASLQIMSAAAPAGLEMRMWSQAVRARPLYSPLFLLSVDSLQLSKLPPFFFNLFIYFFGWSYETGATSIILQENTSVAFNPAGDQD